VLDRKQITLALEHPLWTVKKLWKKKDGLRTQPPTLAMYTEAVDKCIAIATAFMEHASVYAEAKREHELWQKEIELVRARKEVDALKLVIPLLVEQAGDCQIGYETLGETNITLCGERKVLAPEVEDNLGDNKTRPGKL
jgi:hypothetical protein